MASCVIAASMPWLLHERTAAACPTTASITTVAVGLAGSCGLGDGGPANADGLISYTPYRWQRTRLYVGDETPSGAPVTPGDCERQVTPEPDPNAPPDAPPPTPVTEYGTIWLVVMTNVETGEVVAERVSCRFRDEPPPPIPPDPPTVGEVISETAPLLAAEPAYNPRVRGLTGLDTWLWCTGGSQVSTAPATLRGWTYVVTAARSHVAWDITGPITDGAEPEVLELPGNGCGSEADPSAVWMPNVLGEYTLTAKGVWTGSVTATMNWEGITVTAGPFDIGTVTVESEPVPYEIIEHVGVLVG